MVKMEKMRSRMFNPATSESASAVRVFRRSAAEGKENVPPAQQVALFKEEARDRMQARLTELFEATRKASLARQQAKSLARERMAKALEFE